MNKLRQRIPFKLTESDEEDETRVLDDQGTQRNVFRFADGLIRSPLKSKRRSSKLFAARVLRAQKFITSFYKAAWAL